MLQILQYLLQHRYRWRHCVWFPLLCPASRVGALSDDTRLTSVSVWRLSVAYIGPKLKTERPRKTKIGQRYVTSQVTRTQLSRSKGQRSTCRGRGILWRPPAQLVESDTAVLSRANYSSTQYSVAVLQWPKDGKYAFRFLILI